MTVALLMPTAPAIPSQQRCRRRSASRRRASASKGCRSGSHRRADVHALDNVSPDVSEGEFVCLVGPSGCGKSTLLNIIAGLTSPTAARVLADGKPSTGPAASAW